MEKKRETLTEKTLRILTTVHRPFIICIDGIWREVMGVYVLPLIEPYKIKYILNGLEFESNTNQAFDVYGYDEKYIGDRIIQKNLESLPAVPKQNQKEDDTTIIIDTPRFFANGHVRLNRTTNIRRNRNAFVEPELEPPIFVTTTLPIFTNENNL